MVTEMHLEALHPCSQEGVGCSPRTNAPVSNRQVIGRWLGRRRTACSAHQANQTRDPQQGASGTSREKGAAVAALRAVPRLPGARGLRPVHQLPGQAQVRGPQHKEAVLQVSGAWPWRGGACRLGGYGCGALLRAVLWGAGLAQCCWGDAGVLGTPQSAPLSAAASHPRETCLVTGDQRFYFVPV